MKIYLRIAIFFLLTALAVAGCGNSGGNKQAGMPRSGTENEQTSSAEISPADDPGLSVTGSDSIVNPELPRDWPEYVPMMPGSEILLVTTSADGAKVLLLDCPATFSEVDFYYGEVLTENGWVQAGGRFEMRDEGGFKLTYERDYEVLRLQGRQTAGGTELAMSLFSQSADHEGL